MVRCKTRGTPPNIRSTPMVSNNLMDYMAVNTSFDGELVLGQDGKQWIKITSGKGAKYDYPPAEGYIASWVVDYQAVPVGQDIAPDEFPAEMRIQDKRGRVGVYRLAEIV